MAGPPGQQRDPAASHADAPAWASTPLTGRFLPRYDFAVVHTGVFRAPPEACYQAARRVNLFRAPVIRTLIRTRSLAGGLAGRRDAAPWCRSARPGGLALGRQVQPERADPGLEHSGVKRLARTGARLRDSHGFLSSCRSAEAHASTPEHFPQVRDLKNNRMQSHGNPSLPAFAQVRGLTGLREGDGQGQDRTAGLQLFSLALRPCRLVSLVRGNGSGVLRSGSRRQAGRHERHHRPGALHQDRRRPA